MDDVVRSFFEGVSGRHPGTPRTISGTLRFDLEEGKRSEHWLLRFERGRVSVAESAAPADCVVRTGKATMAAIIEGRTNPMAGLLRGTLEVEGRSLLLVVFRGLLPSEQPASRQPEPAGRGGRRS